MEVDEEHVTLGLRQPQDPALSDLGFHALPEAQRLDDLLPGVARVKRQRDLGRQNRRRGLGSRAVVDNVEQLASDRSLEPKSREEFRDRLRSCCS
jgi:hypothetical protein